MMVNLVIVCAIAFLAVMVLLGMLACTIRLLTSIFPDSPASGGGDAALTAAVVSAVATTRPGSKVTRIEEIK